LVFDRWILHARRAYMNGPDRVFVGATRPASRKQGSGLLIEPRFYEQLRKGRMSPVRPAIGQADLGIAGQFEVARRGAMVDDLEHAYFRIDIGCDACRPGQFDVIGTTAEFRAIAEKGMFVEIVRPQNRLVADRPELVVRPIPHVAELAPAIARAVLLP